MFEIIKKYFKFKILNFKFFSNFKFRICNSDIVYQLLDYEKKASPKHQKIYPRRKSANSTPSFRLE